MKMLIISQDRTKITQNMEIFIEKLYEDLKSDKQFFYIKNRTGTLGRYETEERAKEILKEIHISYANIEILKIPNIQIYEPISSERLIHNIVYQMPKE